MKQVKVLVLRTAGTNCDLETAYAFEHLSAKAEFVHINQLFRGENSLEDYHILAIPGGFTYGDDIASGKVLANELRFKLGSQLLKFIADGKLIIGICNGFQVLVKAGLLPGENTNFRQTVTLITNDSAKFNDRWVYLRIVKANKCVWTKGIEDKIYLPVAHAEGKFIPGNDETLKQLWNNGQIVFQYVDDRDQLSAYPWNPNGSVDNIAGICDSTGRILGMMPHPERHFFATHHPQWTRKGLKKEGDGVAIFRNGVNYVKEKL